MKIFFEKIQSIFDIENWLWKYNFGTFWQTIIHRRIILKKIIWACWFLGKNLAFWDPPSLKFHNQTDISTDCMIMPKSITLVLQRKSDCNLQNDSKTYVSLLKKSAVILFLNLFCRMCTWFYDFIMGVMVHK